MVSGENKKATERERESAQEKRESKEKMDPHDGTGLLRNSLHRIIQCTYRQS